MHETVIPQNKQKVQLRSGTMHVHNAATHYRSRELTIIAHFAATCLIMAWGS